MVLSDGGERKAPMEIVREGEAGRGRYRDVGEDREEGEVVLFTSGNVESIGRTTLRTTFRW